MKNWLMLINKIILHILVLWKESFSIKKNRFNKKIETKNIVFSQQ